jgi:ketosteroid isomerase-like protein
MPTGLKPTAICVLAAICGSLAGYTQDLAIEGGKAMTPSELLKQPAEIGPLAVESLRAALQGLCEALNEGDVDSIHKHYLSEVTRFHDSGKLDVGWSEQRAEAFSDYVNDGFGFALERCHVVDARVYGDMGITAGYMYGHMIYPGGTVIEGPWRFTYLWARQDGEWKEAHHHVSLLKAGGN